MKISVFSQYLFVANGIKHRDDVGASMSAIDSIMSHAIISDPPASSGTSEFMDAMATYPAPQINYEQEAVPAPGCERNMEFVYNQFLESFPEQHYPKFLEQFRENLENYKNSSAYTAYDRIPNQPHCGDSDLSSAAQSALKTREVVPYPSQISIPLVGMDLVEHSVNELMKANGPASSQAAGIGSLSQSAIQQQKGLLETVAAIVATDVPPTIPAPAWNNQPFPCLPMVTGHNCAGAVNYPITVGDFILADTSDSYLDGVIANFPSLYKQKVGRTDEKTYNQCFSAYMSMQCANTFPTCTTIQAREQNVPFVGRGPMCFLHCVATLIACPGFWMEDIMDTCRDVSVPPVCSMAHYTKAAPQQMQTFDEAHPYPVECPAYDATADVQ